MTLMVILGLIVGVGWYLFLRIEEIERRTGGKR